MATRVRRSTLKIDNGRLQISLKQAIPPDVVSQWENIFLEVGAHWRPRGIRRYVYATDVELSHPFGPMTLQFAFEVLDSRISALEGA